MQLYSYVLRKMYSMFFCLLIPRALIATKVTIMLAANVTGFRCRWDWVLLVLPKCMFLFLVHIDPWVLGVQEENKIKSHSVSAPSSNTEEIFQSKFFNILSGTLNCFGDVGVIAQLEECWNLQCSHHLFLIDETIVLFVESFCSILTWSLCLNYPAHIALGWWEGSV